MTISDRKRWDDQQRCTFMTPKGQCELRDDHTEDPNPFYSKHATGLRNGHGNPWEYDRCFHFAGGDGTRCVLIYGHGKDHDPPTPPTINRYTVLTGEEP